jgi:hypothetical protein
VEVKVPVSILGSILPERDRGFNGSESPEVLLAIIGGWLLHRGEVLLGLHLSCVRSPSVMCSVSIGHEFHFQGSPAAISR